MPPSYLIYEPFADKISKDTYNIIKNHSFIRLESNDFTGFKSDKRKILMADNEPAALPNFIEFLQEYKDYEIWPRQVDVTVNNLSTAKAISKCYNLNAKVKLNCSYDYDFFVENYKHMNFHLQVPFENESELHYLHRLIRTILFYKSHSATVPFFYNPYNKNLQYYIVQWGLNKTQLSYQDFYKDNIDALKYLIAAQGEIRLLLKTTPKDNRTFDLSHYI